MKNSIKLILASLFFLTSFSMSAQDQSKSYWVTTDAGDQMEVNPDNWRLFENGNRAAGSLTTLYASDNGGSSGGAIYFDIVVGPSDIEVTAFDMNIRQTGSFTVDVYTLMGGYAGNETNAGAWGSAVASGSGTAMGTDSPSNATLNSSFILNANTTYGIALVLDGSHGHEYTNGTGSNQIYSNSDLTIECGTASNAPFTATIFDPRVFNGAVYYENNVFSVPVSDYAIYIGIFLMLAFTAIRFRRAFI